MNTRKKPVIIGNLAGNSKLYNGGQYNGYDNIGQTISEQNLKILSRLQNVSGNISKAMEMPKTANL